MLSSAKGREKENEEEHTVYTNPFKRVLALVLMLAMVLTMVPAFAPAAQAADGDYLTISQLRENNRFTLPELTSDEEVEFLVELEEEPLALTLDDYKSGASVKLQTIEARQSVMAAAIESSDTPMEVTRTYQVVLNGFAVRAPYSAKSELEAMDGVRRVEVAQRYQVPVTTAAEGEITSGSMIDSDRANDEGYTGKGTLTAILDTGLDVAHQAFANDPAEPVYTAADISALTGLKAQATGAELYKSAKIPYAYDYADKDADVSDSKQHGTHVAGTVGANADGFRGVAPDTQLCIMKVFSDKTDGASDVDILAALEDCVILGVDSINMSLGSPCGFTSGGEIVDGVYNRVKASGVNLMIAAGNEESAMAGNLIGTDLALIGNPDYAIVGSPSTYPAALSVASVNEMEAKKTTFLLAGERILYYDSNEQTAMAFANLEGVYDYVRVPGVGNANDFTKVEVTGKIALVERGEIPFTEKEQNAFNSGAIGMIVYDNQEGSLFGMQLNGLLPAVSITKADGKLLKNAEVKQLDISMKHCGRVPDPEGGFMSDFSSIGVAPDLSMKPEITAPGGNVYSTLPGGVYGDMSGTSMACPHMAGAAAVVRQYVDEAFAGRTEQDKQFILNALLMSTADPVLDPYGVPYTPRKQGAGLAKIHSAIHSGAYLTVDGSDRTKAELGDSLEGAYSFTFHVVNFSDAAKTYTLSAAPLVAQVETVNGYESISNFCRQLTADEFTVTFSQNTVTVPAGGTVSVDVSLALTQAGKDAVSVFPNGIYMEGFVTLTADGEGEDLGLPYLGFYGDWGKAPVFDADGYDASQNPVMAGCVMAMMDYQGQGSYLGVNGLDGSFHRDRIAYGSYTASKAYMMVMPILGLLRAPETIRFSVTPENEPEKVVYDVTYGHMMKSFFYPAGGFIYTPSVNWEDGWQPVFEQEWLPDGMYTYHIDAQVAGTQAVQSMEFPICIDNQAPEVVSTRYYIENDLPYLEITVKDNHYVMLAQLVDANGENALSQAVSIDQNAAGDESTMIFELKEIQDRGEKLCRLDMIDYAWNQTTSDLISTNSQDIEAVEVKMGTSRITANTDSSNSEINAVIDPANAKDQTLVWSSTDESVAKVLSVSEDTHTAVIDFVGAGSCQIKATASNGVFGLTQVDVSEAANEWPADNTIRENGTYHIPALPAETIVTITDNAHDVTLVGKSDRTYDNLAVVSQNADLHLTIRDLKDSMGGSWVLSSGAIVFTGTGNTLTLQGDNAFDAHDYLSYAMIRVDQSTELTVNGTGSLTLVSQPYCDGAGIGGDPGQAAGKITIESGDFHINTPGGGAAIGAGANSGTADITILGGTFDMQMPLLNGYPSNQNVTGAAIGSGYYAYDGTCKIRIDGGTFTGKTAVDSAIIGLGFKSSSSAVIDINGGVFDLVSEADSLHGGACIGAALPDGGNYATVDITVNGGQINAVSNSDAAAIGGGAGHKTGSIYINGGTVTAVSSKAGDAIGHGTTADDGNIRISGGTVKTVVTGTGSAFGDPTLTNDDSDNVFLVQVAAPGVTAVTVDGRDLNISANHPEDDNLYLYLTAGTHTVTVTDAEGQHSFQYVIGEDGTVTPVVSYSVTCNLTNLTAQAPAEILAGETLTVPLTAAEGYGLPETVAVTVGGSDAAFTYENGVITVENVQGDVVITAEGKLLADKTELAAVIEEAKALTADAYTSTTWAAVAEALAQAEAVYADEEAEQPAVDAARDALRSAIDNLVRRGDKAKLSAAIAEAKALTAEDYTSTSWPAVAEALRQAEAVYADADAEQAAVDAAWGALRNALDNLIRRGDKTALQAQYDAVTADMNRLCEDVFPSSLWAAAEQALEAASVTLGNPDATQGQIDQIASLLTNAYKSLQAYPVNDRYTDVKDGAWHYDAIDFVTRYGMMQGTPDHRFAPEKELTRAHMVTILYRLEGSPAVEGELPFKDVKAGDYFADAVLWASRNGITEGLADGRFAPNYGLTRQELVTFLMRYAAFKGLDTAKRADLAGFEDADLIPAYAADAMQWAVAEGVVEGVDASHLAPQKTSNRAQMAQVIARMCVNLLWK